LEVGPPSRFLFGEGLLEVSTSKEPLTTSSKGLNFAVVGCDTGCDIGCVVGCDTGCDIGCDIGCELVFGCVLVSSQVYRKGLAVQSISFTKKDCSKGIPGEYDVFPLGQCMRDGSGTGFASIECKIKGSQYYEVAPFFSASNCHGPTIPNVAAAVAGPFPICNHTAYSVQKFTTMTTCTSKTVFSPPKGHYLVFTVYNDNKCKTAPQSYYYFNANNKCIPNGETFASDGVNTGYTQGCIRDSTGYIRNPYINFGDSTCSANPQPVTNWGFPAGCLKWNTHSGSSIQQDAYFRASCGAF